MDAAAKRLLCRRASSLQILEHRRGDAGLADAELLEHRQRGLRRGRVGHGRAGGDHVQRVAEHVGDDQRNEPPGAARPQQAAALDAAELLAHRVELLDVRPGRAEMPRDGQLVGQRNAFDRRRHQRRAAAGDQAQAKVVRPERFDQPQDFQRAGDALGRGLVDAGGPGGVQVDALQGRSATAASRPAR